MINSLSSRGIQLKSDQFRQMQGDEQADLSGRQSVISHFALVGQEGDDVRR